MLPEKGAIQLNPNHAAAFSSRACSLAFDRPGCLRLDVLEEGQGSLVRTRPQMNLFLDQTSRQVGRFVEQVDLKED